MSVQTHVGSAPLGKSIDIRSSIAIHAAISSQQRAVTLTIAPALVVRKPTENDQRLERPAVLTANLFAQCASKLPLEAVGPVMGFG
jgi:hypothetical protein